MFEVKALGKYEIPGRGTVFVADRRDHDFELLKLKGHEVEITHASEVSTWKVWGIERTLGIVPGPIVGLGVKKCPT